MQNDYSSYTNSTKINVISVCVCVCVRVCVQKWLPRSGRAMHAAMTLENLLCPRLTG